MQLSCKKVNELVVIESITLISEFHHKRDKRRHSRHGPHKNEEETPGMVGLFEIVCFPF